MSVTDIHRVAVLLSSYAKGAGLGVDRTDYAAANPPWRLLCRVVPMTGSARGMQLMQQGFERPHRIVFTVKPTISDGGRLLREGDRLRWETAGNNTVLRVASLPSSKQGLDREWVMLVDAKKEDNPSTGDVI